MKLLKTFMVLAILGLLLGIAIAQEKRIEELENEIIMQDALNDAMIDRLNAIPPEFRHALPGYHGPPPQVTV